MNFEYFVALLLCCVSFLSSKGCSKFTMSLTGPDFTSYKIEDPFKRLGPIAIFSARRHWTAPRCVRLQKGSVGYHDVSNKALATSATAADCHCHCAMTSDGQELPCCLLKDEIESFGFHVRGDAPVIISHVEINSLADVSNSPSIMKRRNLTNVSFLTS